MKTMVQTRAKAHTAIGTVCYRFGLEARTTLETPVRQWPTDEETRAFDEAEKRRLAAAKAAGEKTRPRRLLPKLIRMDPPRHYDFRARVGIVASGSAVPEGGAEAWREPLEWARRVEAADGKRLDSRQCRDDVTGIPLELVRSGFADLAVARQAAKVAKLRKTPVHWVIHRPHGAGLNWHAHLVYAGRKLTADGESFEAKRDTLQDKPELVEAHKAFWVETCRELGVDISFDFPGREIEAEVREEFAEEHGRELSEEDERAIQIEKGRRWKEHRKAKPPQHELTPKAVRTERSAVAEEEGLRLDAVIQDAGGAPLAEQDRLELGRISSAGDELDTRQLLALDRIPVTTACRIAKYGRTPEAPAPVPLYRVEAPRPKPAPIVRMELSSSFPLPAGLEDDLPLAVERTLRPPRPAPRAEEVTAPPLGQQRPAVAPEVIQPAPEPPWRRRVRRLLRTVRDWWPWAPTPPSPDRCAKVRCPKHVHRGARPVAEVQRRLAAPQGLARPIPRTKPFLWQDPYGYDFDPVNRTVTINARGREIRAKVRAKMHAGPQPQQTLQPPARARTSGRKQGKSKPTAPTDGDIGS